MDNSKQEKIFSSGMDAGLTILVSLQISMLGALYTQIVPHPPLAIPLFGLGPYISASIAVALAAIIVREQKIRSIISFIACLLALVSFGPHKWFDDAIGLIWPAVLLAQIAIGSVLYNLFKQYVRTTNGN